MTAAQAKRALRAFGGPSKAVFFKRFFKTGKGEYGEGDRFIGVTVPEIRRVARRFADLSLKECAVLLRSPIHEDRLLALVILVGQFRRGDRKARTAVFSFYLRNLRYVNNWDLVDASARDIVGGYLYDSDRSILYRLARSKRLWDRRVAMIATFHFIRQGEVGETLRLAELLLEDAEDLMHKAVGWMLREVGRQKKPALETFLRQHAKEMPRTMLRYAIEHFPESRRKAYLAIPRLARR